MVVSHKFQFIFVKTYKTAGTSLEVFLSKHCGEEDVLTEVYPPVEGHHPRNFQGCYNHMPAIEIKRKCEDIWNSYFKFCIERNPWDKALSFYWMHRLRAGGSCDFDGFLQGDNIGLNWHLYSDEQAERPIVDRILRYEDLDNELGALFAELGVPWEGHLSIRAKADYRLDRRHYREVLTQKQSETIAERFAKEIEWHGYVF